MGASAALAYCHVRRAATPEYVAKGNYPHTDLAAGSWPEVLPALVAQGEWAHKGPTHIPLAWAQRAA